MPRGFSPGDARGEAPCIRKLKVSPFPPGRGSGGWGRKIYYMAGKTGEAGHSPPPGTTTAGRASAARVQPRGCKGRSPLHKKTKSLPLPAGKSALRARVGGMGATKTTNGRGSRRQRRQAPLRTPQRHGQPATSRASSRIGYSNGRSSRQRKNTPSPPKKSVSLLTGFPPSCIIINEKGGSMARIPPPDTRFEQFVKIRICIDNHVTVCYNSDTAEEPRRNAP